MLAVLLQNCEINYFKQMYDCFSKWALIIYTDAAVFKFCFTRSISTNPVSSLKTDPHKVQEMNKLACPTAVLQLHPIWVTIYSGYSQV